MTPFSSGSFLTIVLFCLGQQIISTYGDPSAELIKRLLAQDNITFKPQGDKDKPTTVRINFYVRDFYVMDPSMQFIGAQLTFRQQWNDPRLAYSDDNLRPLSIHDPKSIWTPDIFFSNSRKGRLNDVLVPNNLIRINPNGDVLYSSRVTLDLKCKTDPSLFPLNKVVCPIILASYGSTTKDLVLLWREGDPVQISSSIDLLTYEITSIETGYCTSKTITGEYSCLKAEYNLEPRFGAPFCHLYMPAFFMVLLGWLSFFLQRRNGKIRMSFLLVLLVLGCIGCIYSSWQNPNNSMTLTASNIWSGLCLSFVTYALLHFLMTRHVPCLARLCGYDEEKAARNNVEMQPMMEGNGLDKGEEKGKAGNMFQITSARIRQLVMKRGNRADIIARMLYPTAFIIANIIYWTYYKQY